MNLTGKRVVNTVCGMCNRQSCGMEVTIENGRVVSVKGGREFPTNQGALCVKGTTAKELLYDPRRLKHPIKKKGRTWKKISWSEALTGIADKLKEVKEKYGAESFAVYRGCPQLGETSPFIHRFMNLYGSPNIVTVGSMCALMRTFVDQLTFGSNFRFVDVENSRCIIVWGANPAASNSPYYLNLRTLREAKHRGTKIVVIDPLISGTASIADTHIRIRPGTDGALALGMINVIIERELYDKEFVRDWTFGFQKLFERIKDYSLKRVQEITWVPAKLIEEVACTYAEMKPAGIFLGNALEQHSNSFQTLRAIAILRAITGNIDVQGGNLSISSVKLNDVSLQETLPRYIKPVGWREYPLFTFIAGPPLVSFINTLLTDNPYPIKAMIVSYGNPILTWPDTAKVKTCLERLDFLAVMDFYMTPTAELADIVLPAATFLERTGLHVINQFFSNDQPAGYIALADKAVDEIEECWADWKFWFELAKIMGYENMFPWKNIEDAIDYQLKPTGLSVEKLRGKPGLFYGDIIKLNKYSDGGFKTSTGKVELYSAILRNLGYEPLPSFIEPEESPINTPNQARNYPLVLITGSRLAAYPHSGLRGLPSLMEMVAEPEAFIHPSTAKEFSVKNGDIITIETERGSINLKAEVTEKIIPRTVSIPHGWPQANANILVSNKICDPLFGAPEMKSMLCRIRVSS